ncbi:MAG: dipeptide ABC transporter ATP-binding protein, partial [Alphaproteobacteria bacterium]
MAPLLEINGLTVEFPTRRADFTAVDKVDLVVERGMIHGLVGESGAGKSTIGNAIMGLLERPGRVTGGQIILDGQRIDHLGYDGMRAIRGKKISMIFQDPLTSLNPLLTVGRQIVETIVEHLGVNETEAHTQAVALLEDVGIANAGARIGQYPHQFSGGMRQRVVIALALCSNPELIIADEPTTALDVSIQAQVLDLIKRQCIERDVGVVLITHDMGVIAQTTDQVAVMYQGRVVEHGPTRQVLGKPTHEYTKSLVAAVPRAEIKLKRFPMVSYIEGPAKAFEKIDLSTHWLGHGRANSKTSSTTGNTGKNLVELENLKMDFLVHHALLPSGRRYFTAVDDVSFTIKQGEVFGLVGESGSGKSTIARMIAGLYEPTKGAIRFDGTILTEGASKKSLRPVRRQMQMIFQDPYSSLNARMRVKDIVAEPIRFHRMASNKREVLTIVRDLLDHVGLGGEAMEKFPHEFSGGQRQRISIARALATRPRFLICDEPTSALDVSIQAQILNLLMDLKEELGLTM